MIGIGSFPEIAGLLVLIHPRLFAAMT